MEWYWALTILVGGFLCLVIIGIPVFYTFMVMNLIGMYLFMGGMVGLGQIVDSMYGSLTVFILMPIPLFILMGEIMLQSGIATRAIDALDLWFGRVRGRLSFLSVASGCLFASLSGSSIGSTAMLGRSLIPEMQQRGYKTPLSVGPILGSGGLAIMIPPSGLGVVLAVVAEVSVGKLLVAIVIPGLLMAILYSAYILIRCRINPELAPSYEVEIAPLDQRLSAAIKHIFPFGFLIFAVIGTIFLGVATPTEAAALGVLATIILAASYRSLNWNILVTAVRNALQVTVMILLILGAASVFAQLMAFSGVTRALAEWTIGHSASPLSLIIIMLGVTLILGGFVTGLPLMLITIPVFLPVVKAIGYDPLWFSVIFLLLVEMAQTTPPHGTLLYVMKSVAPAGTKTSEIIKAGLPFLACDTIVVIAMIAVPQIVLWLPSVMEN